MTRLRVVPWLLLLALLSCESRESRLSQHREKADALLAEEKWEEAAQEFERALEVDPNRAPVHYGLAQAHLGAKDLRRAFWELDETVRLDPNHVDARLRLGETRTFAVELAPHNIRVNSIHPGFIDTPMTRAQGLENIDVDKLFAGGVPLGRAGRPEDIVNMALFLASEESSYCSGAEFIVDGGVTSFVGWGGHVPRME